MEIERTCAQNGEDRIMKIQDLVCNRPSLIRSRVGSVSAFGCMLQLYLLFPPTYVCTGSVQAKSKTEQCQCAFKYRSSARKRERECYNYVCVQFSVDLCQCIHICVHMYFLPIVQELCRESRGGRPGLSVLTSLLVSVDVKLYWTMLRHWSQLVPNMSTDIWGH